MASVEVRARGGGSSSAGGTPPENARRATKGLLVGVSQSFLLQVVLGVIWQLLIPVRDERTWTLWVWLLGQPWVFYAQLLFFPLLNALLRRPYHILGNVLGLGLFWIALMVLVALFGGY